MSKPFSLPRRRAAGFTLIELMVTVAIGAVLMMVAAPSFIGFQRNSEMTSLTNALLAAANTARAEAMKTGMNAFVVPSGNGSGRSQGGDAQRLQHLSTGAAPILRCHTVQQHGQTLLRQQQG